MLLDHDRAIVDSAVICEYLEETGRSGGCSAWIRSIGPRCGAWWRGSIKFLREVTDLIWREGAQVRHRSRAAELRGGAGRRRQPARPSRLHRLPVRAAQWLAGEHISLADIAAGAYLSVLDYRRRALGGPCGAKLWYARLKSRPSFRPLLADRIACLKPTAHYDDLDF